MIPVMINIVIIRDHQHLNQDGESKKSKIEIPEPEDPLENMELNPMESKDVSTYNSIKLEKRKMWKCKSKKKEFISNSQNFSTFILKKLNIINKINTHIKIALDK